ncbi:MAG TPA: SusC/RagA family TonB-linked outer membrane protein [Gemmatimonadaceae bacterium]
MTRFLRPRHLVVACLLSPLAVAAQSPATTISGRVTDAAAGAGIPSVQVTVVGTNVGAVTNDQGRYVIRGAPAGTLSLRAIRIGYGETVQSVTVAAGQAAVADFTMRAAPVNLSPVVTTAAGVTTRREEVGHTDYSVDAAKTVETSPVANMTDLLTARAPSVQVLNSTTTGGGARVRIRGTSSLSLNNEPIYIIDGVRMTSNVSSIDANIFTGGTAPSRVGDLNPEEIETIEVVPGPSASTLYGTDAANGVIVITTKRGRAGRTRFNTYVEHGLIEDLHQYPTAYSIAKNGTTARATRLCTLPDVAAGTCAADSLFSFNLFDDKSTTPLGTGERAQYGLQIRGGTEAVRYFTSGEYEQETGIQKIPDFDLTRARTTGIKLLDAWRHPSQLQRASLRANVDAALSPKADISVNSSFLRSTLLIPQSDNNAAGLFSNALGGPGYSDAVSGGIPLHGYRAFTPLEMFQAETYQYINRFLGSVTGNYRPLTWLSGTAVLGADVTNRNDTQLCRRATCANSGTRRQGFKTDNRAWFYTYTANGSATGSFQPTTKLGSKTTVGVQYVNRILNGNETFGSNLPVGSTAVGAAAVQSAGEFTTISRTLGAFIEEALSWEDRIYLTGAIRTDQNSAFGTNFQHVYYPKVNGAWVISREHFFPAIPGVTSLRLRAAVGASGQQPGPNDALQYYAANIFSVDQVDQPSVQLSTLGNPNLRPERATEAEGGLELHLLEDRVSYEGTYFNKLSRDALIAQVIPGSLGTGATTQFANLGAVKNLGFEHILRAAVFDRPYLRWDLTATYNTLTNRIVSLGPVPFPPGGIIQQRVGYPLNSYWGQKILSYRDANGDGIISPSEVVVDPKTTYIGSSQPRYESVLDNSFEVLSHMLRINTVLDFKGGFVVRNGTERIRCQNRVNCTGVANPKASLFEQARAVALINDPARTSAGYNEKVHFTRLRELSFTFLPKQEWTQRFLRSDNTSLTLGIRNVHIWTNYTGIDPESNYGQDDVQNDFQTLPPPTYFTLRLNLGF